MTMTVDAEDKSVQKPPVIMQEVLLYYEKQTVPRLSVALAMKNKTPFDMTLKVFVSEKNLIFFENPLHRTSVYGV